jgi:ribosomal protein S18 acetylase RimI-like enzyme
MSPIRPATIKDVLPILLFKTKAQQEGYQGILDQAYLDALTVTPQRIQKFQQRIEKCDVFLVYEEENSLKGFICGGIADIEEESPYLYEIGSFYVDPDRQRKGI